MPKKTKKVFVPPWYKWVMIPMMVGIWLFITYLEFFSTNNEDELGLVGYLFFTVLFLGLSIMFWLMASGRLPAYIIEEEVED
jgi:Na+-driven multidrug efflux pump